MWVRVPPPVPEENPATARSCVDNVGTTRASNAGFYRSVTATGAKAVFGASEEHLVEAVGGVPLHPRKLVRVDGRVKAPSAWPTPSETTLGGILLRNKSVAQACLKPRKVSPTSSRSARFKSLGKELRVILGISHELGQEGASQRLQVAPELAEAAVERRSLKSDDPREEVREEASGLAQEGALGLHAGKVLQEGDGDDLQVRKLLERFVTPGLGVEEPVGIVYEAERNHYHRLLRLFQEAGFGVSSGWAIRSSFGWGPQVALVLPYKPRNTRLEGREGRFSEIRQESPER